jgi:hypothetical protein
MSAATLYVIDWRGEFASRRAGVLEAILCSCPIEKRETGTRAYRWAGRHLRLTMVNCFSGRNCAEHKVHGLRMGVR